MIKEAQRINVGTRAFVDLPLSSNSRLYFGLCERRTPLVWIKKGARGLFLMS